MNRLVLPRVSLTALLLFVFVSAPALSDDEPSLTVITYNVQFLPGVASVANKRKEPEYRAQRIADEVSAFDIVALQEVFHDEYRQQIIDGIQKHWGGEGHVFVSPTPEGRFNGGCMVMTRLPVLETHAMIFEHFSSPDDYGVRADGFAAKGVIHARIARDADDPSAFVDVYVTHLEARADELRPLQYAEMAAFVKETADADAPALFLGDFNTRGMAEHRADTASQYNQLVQALTGAKPGTIDLWPELMGDALGGTSEQESADIGKRIDYVFLEPGSPLKAHLQPIDIRVALFQDARVTALSDHNAVVARLAWRLGTS